jgi:hypothetical protein
VFDSFELGEILANVNGGPEEDADVGFGEHEGVVVGIAGGDDPVVELAEGGDGMFLLVGEAELVIGDVVVMNDEAVAEEGGPVELTDQGCGELFEGIGEDDDRHLLAQLAEELECTREGLEGGDNLLDIGEAEVVLVEDGESPAHEAVVIGLIAGGAAQFGNAGFFGDGDPDFRGEHSFHVECGQRLLRLHGERGFQERCRLSSLRP